MNSGGNFGPELPGSFPASAAEKQKSSTSDCVIATVLKTTTPAAPLFPRC